MYWSPITILVGIFGICLILYSFQQIWRFIKKKPSKSNGEEEIYQSQSDLKYDKYQENNPDYDKYKADVYRFKS
ncbi:hypothetical protein NSA47_08755 [Irregularibacter muris]|uniref:Uncharacterized protein n=1 Tax=Irregularibacter muris TaxID=1796619 RepID=A0AAE3KZD8_9FIRM|nr:hypothetical protein [Irregularibacter muris]MCR1899070.1 hypothetical protein [Irregularibacter muris]